MAQQNPCFTPTGNIATDALSVLALAIPHAANVMLNIVAVWKIYELSKEVHTTKRIVQKRRAELDAENGKSS